MKKFFVIALMGLMALTASAQSAINVGYAGSSLKEGDASIDYNGVFVSYDNIVRTSSDLFALRFGVTASFGEDIDKGEILDVKTTWREAYVDVPLSLVFTPIKGLVNIYPYAGLTPSFGIVSNVTTEANALGIKTKTTEDLYNDLEDYHRFDILAGGGVIAEVACLRFNVGYDYGLLNRYGGESDYPTHRANFHVGVGYKF